MTRRWRFAVTLTLFTLFAGLAVVPSADAATSTKMTAGFGCATARSAGVHCLGRIRAHRAKNGRIAPMTMTEPTGLLPADLESAYNVAGDSGDGGTVAIVDAMDDPNAESDLAVYRSTTGLPPCTSEDGCFTKVNQDGDTAPLPDPDVGWAEEISLDLDMVSAMCPDCTIMLVEADSADVGPLSTAEDTAATAPGVVAVSNSWGGAEDSTTKAADSHFDHPGVAITASSGDGGFGVSWPASSPMVTGVGGTSLKKAAGSRGWTETAWSGAGSGCSSNEPKPPWQQDANCKRRTVADVAAVADPNTGVGVFDTFNDCGTGVACDALIQLGLAQGLDGWAMVGGTSAAAPIIASVYALAGNTGSIDSSFPYSHPDALFDVTSGSNGDCGNDLCTAGPGYDGPTGLGTPDGTGAF